MSYCEFCGKGLVEGEGCNCDEAKQNRWKEMSQSGKSQNKFCGFCGKVLSEGECCNCDEDRARRLMVSSSKQSSITLEKSSEVAKQVMGELETATKDFIKMPTAFASENALSLIAAIVLLLVEAVTFGVMACFFTGKALKLASYMFGYADVNMVQIFLQSTFVVFVNIVVIFASIYVVSFLFKTKLDIQKLVVSLSIASVVWSISFSVIAVTSIILAIDILGWVVVFLTVFALLASVLILSKGIEKEIPNDDVRMLIISLAYGLGVCILFVIVNSVLKDFVQQLSYLF